MLIYLSDYVVVDTIHFYAAFEANKVIIIIYINQVLEFVYRRKSH